MKNIFRHRTTLNPITPPTPPLFYFLLLLLHSPLLTSTESSSTTTTTSYSYKNNRDACYDLDVVDSLSTLSACERRCTLHPRCRSFGYHLHLGNKRCHLCSRTTPQEGKIICGADSEDDDEVCSTWGIREDDFSDDIPSRARDEAIAVARRFCSDATSYDDDSELPLSTPTPDEAYDATNDLNALFRYLVSGVYPPTHSFVTSHSRALDDAAAALSYEDDDCFFMSSGPYDDRIANCTHGGVLFLQLRALLLLEDEVDDRAFPYPRDRMRAEMYDDYRVLVADNGWFSGESLEAIQRFFEDLSPKGLMEGGVEWRGEGGEGGGDVPFVVLTARDAYSCEGDDEASSFLDFTRRGMKVFQTEFHQFPTDSFPNDTPLKPRYADSLITVVRHETAHQFDHVMQKNPRLQSHFHKLVSLSRKDDDWLRSTLTDEFFQNNNQEIMASQIGNQYFHSTSAQLRLAAYRLYRETTPFPTEDDEEEDYATDDDQGGESTLISLPSPITIREGFSCQGHHDLGDGFTSYNECIATATADPACTGHQIMWSPEFSADDWGCRCCPAPGRCDKDEDLYESSPNWNLYQYRDEIVPEPCANPAVLLKEGRSCVEKDKDLGKEFASVHDCAAAAAEDESCTGHEIMWSEYSFSWGCHCCSKHSCDGAPSEEELYHSNEYWGVYSYRHPQKCDDSRALRGTTLQSHSSSSHNNDVEPRTTTTIDTDSHRYLPQKKYTMDSPKLAKHSCNNNYNLGDEFATRQECANTAILHPSCTGDLLMWSQFSSSWGCRCCPAPDACSDQSPDKKKLYQSNDNWSLYQYRDESAVRPECRGTRLPLAWFLFNLDFMSMESDTVTFYEDGVDGVVDGIATPVCVRLTRDEGTKQITSINVPGCGVINFGYDDEEDGTADVATSVDMTALRCVADPNALPVC